MIQFATPQHDHDTDLDRLADEIAELAAHIDAATYRLLVLLREFDERNGWTRGFRTCAHWLSWRTGIDVGAARERVRVARALAELPLLSDALRRGVLSYSKARALTRVATAANESELLELAHHGTAAHIERVVRGWRQIDRIENSQKHDRRELSLYVDHDGSYVIRGRLDPETGAVLERALDMARQQLPAKMASGAQQRADALGLMAELALRGGGGHAERFQVVLHVSADGAVELDSGLRVSAETSRRLSCDATRVVMTEDARGEVLDVGRRTRTVPPAIRRALDRRDGGCRFPGCGLRHCDAHHVRHWADGGATSLDNLVLLCRFHHRLLHEESYSVEPGDVGKFTFRAADGSPIAGVPLVPALASDALETLRREHEQAGLDINAATAPVWCGDRFDLDYTLRALRRS